MCMAIKSKYIYRVANFKVGFNYSSLVEHTAVRIDRPELKPKYLKKKHIFLYLKISSTYLVSNIKIYKLKIIYYITTFFKSKK